MSTLASEIWLIGGGEMGALIRSMDWSGSSVGPIAAWPQSLRTALGICLSSRFPMAIWWGPDIVQFYNDGYRPFLGTKHPRSMGQRGDECWAEIWDICGPLYRHVMTTGKATWSADLQLLMERSGYLEETYFTFSYSPIRGESADVLGNLITVTETTERVLGERRLRTLRDLGALAMAGKTQEEAARRATETLAANAADVPFSLLYLVDEDGRHARLVAASGLQPGALASPMAVDVTGEESVWPIGRVVRSARPVVADHLSAAGPLPHGPWSEPAHTALVLPLLSGEAVAGVLVAAVSPRRRLDDAYRSFYDVLAGQIATALANARAHEEQRKRAESLAALDRAKTEFFSNVSHEFRTPLTLMLGPLTDALGSAKLPADERELLLLAERNSQRLLKLVNTLLDFSRIEAGRAEAVYEPVDIAALIIDLASTFRAAIERAGLRLVVDCPPSAEPVWVDREMWEKIVLNLLSNAFKFTFEGAITVRVRDADERVMVEVADTGIGIGPNDLPHIFERFNRVRGARSRTHEGTGIGLALVQELVRLHGGIIDVTSHPGVGTTFSIAIPRGQAHLPADRIGAARARASTAVSANAFVEEALRWLPDNPAPSPALAPSGTAGARILLADDNADMREYLKRLLAPYWTVDVAADGYDALRSALAAPPDLIVSDIMMPRVDGYGLLKALRADPRTAPIPVILLSARAGEEARVEGLGAGADDYLVKPFGARELIARVEAHLALARARREVERQLDDFFENGMLAFHWVAADGTILRANRAELELLGYAAGEYIGHNVAEFHADADVVGDIMQRLCAGQSIHNCPARLRAKDGSIKHVLLNANVRWDGDRFLHTRCFTRDVTELRRAEEERDRLLAAEQAARSEAETLNRVGRQLAAELDREPLAQAVTDAATGVTGADFGAFFYRVTDGGEPGMRYTLAGVPRETLVDFPLSWNVPLFDLTFRHARVVRLDDIRVTGVRSYLAVPVVRSHEVLGGLFLGHAAPGRFTERHERLLEGLAAQAAIAIDNARHYRAEHEARRAAEAGSRAKDEFLAMLAHELRNPLGVILNGVKILDQVGEQSDGAVRIRTVMKRQTAHLSRLLDDLLDVARISQGKIALRPELLDLRTVVEGALESERHRLIAQAQHLEVSAPEAPVIVYGDSARLQQVVANLVHNASKYTPERGRVSVILDDHGAEAQIRVRDTGVGIPREKLTTIFDPFVQLDASPDRSRGGLGIGLTLVQRLVAQHGGRVEACSEGIGHGSEFIVTLPVARAAGAGAAPVSPPEPARRSLHILLIEDNADAREMLKLGLTLAGHRVNVAADGAEGIERALSNGPDVAIVDLGLPGIDGLDVARTLRAKFGGGIRLVALSGYGRSIDRQRAQEAGFDAHVTKPATVDEVLAALP